MMSAVDAVYPHIGYIHRALDIEPELLFAQALDLDCSAVPADALPLVRGVEIDHLRSVGQLHLLPRRAVELLS